MTIPNHLTIEALARLPIAEIVALPPEELARLQQDADEAVRKANIAHPRSPLGPRLTISVGSATADDLSGDPLALVAFADKLLYAAKASGRDQVTVGHLTPPVAAKAA